MARYIDRIATRMWLLAGLMTAITLAVGIAFFYVASYYELFVAREAMPARIQAELDQIIARGERGSERYFEIFDRYQDDQIKPSDIPFLAFISIVSTLAGGSIAFVMASRISRPITSVIQAATLVASGDRSARAEEHGASGETAELVESFNRMAADIEAYERERTVLTAGIAHELRTPLTILKGRLHGLIDGVIQAETGEAERLLRQVEQLSRLVEDLRTLAHADAGELELDLRNVDLAYIARIAVTDLRATASHVRFELACEPVKVAADPLRLTQILTNLLTNAIKQSSPGGLIVVTTRKEGTSAVARVSDEGPGFREEDSKRLFLPFWRAGLDKSAGRPGSGMGLALAAKLAEAQGGRIEAANRADRSGAVFTLFLPPSPAKTPRRIRQQ